MLCLLFTHALLLWRASAKRVAGDTAKPPVGDASLPAALDVLQPAEGGGVVDPLPGRAALPVPWL